MGKFVVGVCVIGIDDSATYADDLGRKGKRKESVYQRSEVFELNEFQLNL